MIVETAPTARRRSNVLGLTLKDSDFLAGAVYPSLEMGAYEALWCERGATF